MDRDLLINPIYDELKKRGSDYIANINIVYNLITPILGSINKTFPNYTLHDMKHSIRILKNISDLIDDRLCEFNELELVIIIYCALLHDIGMYVDEKEKQAIIEGKYNNNNLNYSAIYKLCNNENQAIQEFVRPIHGVRSEDYIINNLNSYMVLIDAPDIHFTEYVSRICRSHNEDFSWIKTSLVNNALLGECLIDLQLIAVMLRIGDILDFDSRRAPKVLYNSILLGEFSDSEWKKHFITKNTRKIHIDNGKRQVILSGICDCPKTFRNINKYIQLIDDELNQSQPFLNAKNIIIHDKTKNKIETEGFKASNLKINMNYNAIMNILMNRSLYGKKEAAFREIMQNSIDACRVMRKVYRDELNEYKPTILITVDKARDTVSIQDNGIGMTKHVLEKYYLSAGESYYKSKEFKYKGIIYDSIGNYGIGFLSSFMLSDIITIYTKSYFENSEIRLDLEKDSEHGILRECNTMDYPGTKIIFNYKQFKHVFLDISEIEKHIKENFLFHDISIFINDVDSNSRKEVVIDILTDTISIKYDEETMLYLLKTGISNAHNSMNIPHYGRKHYCFKDKVTSLIKSKSPKDIKQYLYNNYINVMHLVLIGDSASQRIEDLIDSDIDDYKAYEIVEEDGDFEDIYFILYPSDDLSFYDIYLQEFENAIKEEYTATIESGDNIILNYSYDDFCNEFGHSYEYLDIELRKYQVVTDDNNPELLFYVRVPAIDVLVYCKDIFIRGYNITLSKGLYIYYPKKIIVNVNSPEIIPNLARDNFENSFEERLRLNIEKSILVWNIRIQKDENIRQLLKQYMKKAYN